MQISLPPELESQIQSKIASGVYADESEVICAALDFFLMQEGDEVGQFSTLRAAIAAGVAELDRGEFAAETIPDLIASMKSKPDEAL